MTDKLYYVLGYGFCLTGDTGNHALDLDGNGALTEDKQVLLDAFASLVTERDALLEVVKPLSGDVDYGTRMKQWCALQKVMAKAELDKRDTRIKELEAELGRTPTD